jgi:VWFA-related protein
LSSARFGIVCGALAAALVATAILDARLQDPAQPTFRADASYVRVDVYPTADGVPVADLTRDDFEVLEDNRPQAVTAFEHVTIRGGVPQELRAEPNTVAQSKAMLENPRARVFVVFLDTNHVSVDGSHNIRQPLVNALNRLIGADDLVGVMTPEMSASDVTFARRTTTIEGFLTKYWTWGQRDQLNTKDPVEEDYKLCYPGLPTRCVDDRGIADEMIVRRREKISLDALDDLVRYLAFQREERTAVLAITDGWLLYRPNPSLSRSVSACQGPPIPRVGVDPRSGRITSDQTQPGSPTNPTKCESDRMNLAMLDDSVQFQTMLDRANRANVSFYPIDPRGLAVFDTPIDIPATGIRPAGTPAFAPPVLDATMLRARMGTLRDLAAATDGIAILNSNDLEGGFRRVTADLSSYYLLGYYSTGKLDGKFHAIRVRVKRPGVQVRARRGYLALTAAEATTLRTRPGAPSAADSGAGAAAVSALATALSTLGSATRDTRVHLRYAVSRQSASAPQDSSAASAPALVVWAVGEFGAGDEWRTGAEVDLILTAPDGHTISTGHERVGPGLRSFRSALRSAGGLPAGDYTVRIRATPLGPNPEPLTEIFSVVVPANGLSGVLITRRGPATGNREMPSADARFRRNEQLRVDVPGPSSSTATARLLDRAGNAMAIPIAATVRTDPDGARWISAPLALAPLAVGDYVIEISDGAGGNTTKTLVAFRVIP